MAKRKFLIKQPNGRFVEHDGEILAKGTYLKRMYVLVENPDKNGDKYIIYEQLTGTLVTRCNAKTKLMAELKKFLENKESIAESIYEKNIPINGDDFFEGHEFAEKIFMEHPDYNAFYAGFIYFMEENTNAEC